MNDDAPLLSMAECEQLLRFWTQVTDVQYVTLVAIHPDSQAIDAKTFTSQAIEDACSWIADHQAIKRNIYFQPNETSATCASKPGKADMVAGLCRHADVDPDDKHFELAGERARLAQLAGHMSRDPTMPPTVVIDSGNGMQFIWAVTREPLDGTVLSRIESENHAIEAALGAGGTHNIDRLLRLPGTLNYPDAAKRNRGRSVCRARLIFSAPNLYLPSDAAKLAEHLSEQLAGTGLIRPKRSNPDGAGKAKDADLAALIAELQGVGADKVTEPKKLSAILRSRLYKALSFRPRLASRWAGNVDDLIEYGRDATGSGVDLSLAAMLKAAGFSHLDTALILCAFRHGKTNNCEWADPQLRLRHVARSVLRSYEPAGPDVPAFVHEFNRKYMVVNEAGKGVVYAPVIDHNLGRQRLDRITFDDLRRLYLNRMEVGFDNRGNKVLKNVASVWLEHPDRRQYIDGITFDPSGRTQPGTLNLWQEFAVTPAQGDWSLMKRHIWEVICNKDAVRYRYLMGWLARLVQYPAVQGEAAVVMKGGEGTGKGTFAKAVLHLLGQHGMAISNAKHLVGNFNGHLRDCIFLFADEAFYAGDKQHVGVLKSLITEPYLTIEATYQNALQTPNFLHVMMASNEDWLVPAGLDARRFLVLVVSEHRKGDHEYFAAISKQMNTGGYEAMLYDLQNRDIANFNVRSVPITDGLQEQKKLSLQTAEAWWVDVLHRGYIFRSHCGLEEYFGEWHDEFPTELLYASYSEYAGKHRERHPLSRENLGKKLVNFGAQPTRPRDMVIGEHMTDVENGNGGTTRKAALIRHPRPPAYHLGTLEEARNAFATATGLEIDWQDSTDTTEEVGQGTTSEAKWRLRL